MKPLLALLALPLLAQSAPRPAWEVADRWTCDATSLRICDGLGEACALKDNAARFRLDFKAARLFVGGDWNRPRPFALEGEKIAARHFWPGGDSPGYAKVALETGDTLAIEPVPLEGKPDEYAMVMTRADTAAQYSFFGSCTPAR